MPRLSLLKRLRRLPWRRRAPKSRLRRVLRRALPYLAGAGIGAGATVGALIALSRKRPGTPNSVAYDRRTRRIIWWTYRGGPIFSGPKDVMIRIIKTGARNRKAGIKLLVSNLRAGRVQIIGRVS